MHIKRLIISLSIYLSRSIFVSAMPINSNEALTPSQGQVVVRLQARYLYMSDVSEEPDRMKVWALPIVFVYGLTERLGIILNLPYMSKEKKVGQSEMSKSGIADMRVLSKYWFWRKDSPAQTMRFSFLAGLELPTGDENVHPRLGSGSIDPVSGILFTMQSLDQEFDIGLIYQFNTKSENYEFGDIFRYDLAYQRRVLPWTLPEEGVSSQLNLVLELNGSYAWKDKSGGSIVKDSGGNILFISPGVQFVTERVVFESSIQLPIIQNLGGNQLKTNYTLTTGMRFTF